MVRLRVYYRVKVISKDTLPDGTAQWSEELLEMRFHDYADAMNQCEECLQWERDDVQFAYPVRCQETRR